MEEKKIKIEELLKRIQDLERVVYYPSAQNEAEINFRKTIVYIPVNPNPNLHYHGSMPCYNNPCVWC